MIRSHEQPHIPTMPQDLQSLSSLFDGVPVPVVILDDDRRTVYYNQTYSTLLRQLGNKPRLGVRPGNAFNCLNTRGGTVECGSTSICTSCGAFQAISSALTGTPSGEECQIPVIQNGNQVQLDLRVWASPFTIDDTLYTLFYLVDVSDEKRKMILERIFYHDVLNTVQSIIGYTELLSMDPLLEDDSRVRNLAQATNSLAEEILAQRDLVTAERGELVVKPMAMKANAPIIALLERFNNHRAGKGKSINYQIPEDNPLLRTDPVLLKRVLGNLLLNALEATDSGGAVKTGISLQDSSVTYWVWNEAVIPASAKARIFQQTFSTKGRGRGLGTYCIRLLTETYLCGHVNFTSTPGDGTTFTVELPLDIDDIEPPVLVRSSQSNDVAGSILRRDR